MARAAKHELLFRAGINFDALPTWQKRGFALYWGEYQRAGHDPRTGKATVARRRELRTDYELPWNEAYDLAIISLLEGRPFPAPAVAQAGSAERAGA